MFKRIVKNFGFEWSAVVMDTAGYLNFLYIQIY